MTRDGSCTDQAILRSSAPVARFVIPSTPTSSSPGCSALSPGLGCGLAPASLGVHGGLKERRGSPSLKGRWPDRQGGLGPDHWHQGKPHNGHAQQAETRNHEIGRVSSARR